MQMRYARARGPDGWTNGRSLSLSLSRSLSSPLLQFPHRYLLARSLLFPSSLFESNRALISAFFHSVRYVLPSYSSFVSTLLRFFRRSSSVTANTRTRAHSLSLSLSLPFIVFPSYSSIPQHLVFFSFFRFLVYFFFLYFCLRFSTTLLSFLSPPLPLSASCSAVPFRSARSTRLARYLPFHSLFIARSFVAHCYQLTPTLVLPLTFQRSSRRLLLFPPSAVSRTRKKEKTRRARITRTKRARENSIFDLYSFLFVDL